MAASEKFSFLRINPFLAIVPILYPPEYTRKPLIFCCFQGVQNENLSQKWIKKVLKGQISKYREEDNKTLHLPLTLI